MSTDRQPGSLEATPRVSLRIPAADLVVDGSKLCFASHGRKLRRGSFAGLENMQEWIKPDGRWGTLRVYGIL
jgi:hypothetical protein